MFLNSLDDLIRMVVYCTSCKWPLAEGLEKRAVDLFIRERFDGLYLCGVRDPDLSYILTDERQIDRDDWGKLLDVKDIHDLKKGMTFEIRHKGLGIISKAEFVELR